MGKEDLEKSAADVAIAADAAAVKDDTSSADYDSVGIENRGIEPVPASKREPANAFASFTLWASSNMVISSFSTGTLGASLFFLNFRDGLLILIFFNLLGILPVAFFSTFGPKFGMRQMVITRYSFGYYGAWLIALLNILACIGWSAVNVVVGGQVINALDGNIPIWVGILIIAVLTTAVAIFGYKWIHAYERYAYIPMTIIFLIVLGYSAKYWYTDSSVPSDVGGILSFGGTIYGFATGWTSYAADYNSYQPADVSSVAIFINTFLGVFIPLFFVELVGFGAATAVYNNEDYAAAAANGAGSLVGAVLDPLGGFGKFLMVLLALSIIANNIPNDYSLGLSVQVFGKAFENVKRIWWTLLGAVVYVAIAIPSITSFHTALENFLLVVAYWLAAYASIAAVEHFVFRKGRFDSYDMAAWDTPALLPSGVPAVLAFLVGMVGAVLGMAQAWYVGTLALKISAPFGGDIGFELSAGFAAVTYLAARYAEITYFNGKV